MRVKQMKNSGYKYFSPWKADIERAHFKADQEKKNAIRAKRTVRAEHSVGAKPASNMQIDVRLVVTISRSEG